jgi:hypothetical protein
VESSPGKEPGLGPLSDKRGFDALFLAWHLDDPETLSTDLETKGVEMKKEVDAKEAVLLLAHGMDPVVEGSSGPRS